MTGFNPQRHRVKSGVGNADQQVVPVEKGKNNGNEVYNNKMVHKDNTKYTVCNNPRASQPKCN